jgi:fructosamine-3-kinase
LIFEEISKRIKDKIVSKKSIGGGDINQSFKIETDKGRNYFIKYNPSISALSMFASEADGLSSLSLIQGIITPKVIDFFEISSGACLLLDYIHFARWTKDSHVQLGEKLAFLHRYSSDRFGYNFNNYLATILQNNQEHDSFIDFYLKCRIEPLIRELIERKLLLSKYSNWCDQVYHKLSSIIPNEQPALLHGDLWSGNVMNSPEGPVFIDPAVYFGHREIDMAMTKLFGGFSESFYVSYNQSFPLEKGWENRIDIFQLYPLLVHVRLFGNSYVGNTMKILNKYS